MIEKGACANGTSSVTGFIVPGDGCADGQGHTVDSPSAPTSFVEADCSSGVSNPRSDSKLKTMS